MSENEMSQQSTSVPLPDDIRGPQDLRRIFNELCHMVALSRTGKAATVTEALVERILVLTKPAPGDAPCVAKAIADRFGVLIPVSEVEHAITMLVQAGSLRRHHGEYVLGQRAIARVTREIEDARALEERVRTAWVEEALQEDDRLADEHRERLWQALRYYMEEVFLEHGALSAELLQSSSTTPVSDDSLLRHAQRAIERAELGRPVCDAALTAIRSFFDSGDADRNEYIAQHLDATFTIYALSTPAAAATYLRDQMPDVRLFLDTNFVFELLDLHVDPGHDVSKELVRFVRDNNLPVSIYYHERTLREIKATLGAIGHRLRSRRWSESLSRATLRTATASGVELKYHSLNAESPLSPDVFMRRFEENIPELLREFGAHLYRPRNVTYTDQEKAFLVMEYDAYLTEKRPDMDKQYETIEHDATVLLTLREHRNDSSSALHSGALFLTNDRTLQRFDRERYRGVGAPHVVLPQALLQVLRPFGEISSDANRRFVRAFGVPELRTAHSGYDETAAELRSHLATYQDLPEETAVAILGNELLRTRLESTDTPTEFEQIVEKEVVRLNAELVEERDGLQARTKERETRIGELERRLSRQDAELAEARNSVASLSHELEETRGVAAQSAHLTDLVNELLADKESREASDRRRNERRQSLKRFGLAGVGALLTVLVLWAVTAEWQWLASHDHQTGIRAWAVILVLGAWTAWALREWKAVAVTLLIPVFVGVLELL